MRTEEKKSGRTVVVALLLITALPALAVWIFDGRRSSWEGTPEELREREPAYPVLLLELGGAWTDFELKASTNDFVSMVYYVKSSGTNALADDPQVLTYFTDDYAADTRVWLRSPPGVAIGGQLVDPLNSVVSRVVVMPSHGCAVDWSGWMSPANSNLVWSYVRYDGIGMEMNATGTKSRWSAVVPVQWRTERIEP